MPVKYAIKHRTPNEELIKKDNGVITNPFTYIDVPKSVAEADEDSGVSAVFNTNDERVSPWILVTKPRLQEELAKVKPGNPLKDSMGTMLAVGDYVLTSFGDSHSHIVCRVMGFTSKMVRIHDLSRNVLVARNPDLLVQVHSSVITD
jgi:hypothetical protein